MNAAPKRSEVNARRSRRLLEIGRIHSENGAARHAIAAGAIREDWPQQNGFQICLGVHSRTGCLDPGGKARVRWRLCRARPTASYGP